MQQNLWVYASYVSECAFSDEGCCSFVWAIGQLGMVGLARIVVVVCVDVALMQCARVMLAIAVTIRSCVVYELVCAMFTHVFVLVFFLIMRLEYIEWWASSRIHQSLF